jgi:hypothetical protein
LVEWECYTLDLVPVSYPCETDYADPVPVVEVQPGKEHSVSRATVVLVGRSGRSLGFLGSGKWHLLSVGARPVDVLSVVTVVAQRLESGWVVVLLEPAIHPAAAVDVQRAPMHIPASVDMIEAQELLLCLTAASAHSTVGVERLLAAPVGSALGCLAL